MLGMRVALLPAVVIALAACGGDTAVDPETSVSKVTISASPTALAVGATLQLTADAANAAGTILVEKTINWVSSRPDIATITSRGLVTGVSTGTTTITAKSEGRSASIALTVQAPNKIVLTSEVGDYVGQGETYTYTKANAVISLSAKTTSIQLSISGNQGWRANFQTPSGVELAAGSYTNATRWPFQGSGAGLEVSGEGRGCNMLTGFFVIDSLSWDTGNSLLLGLDLRFEQHCEGRAPALRGTIHWRADDPTTPPGPVTPIPSTLWQPPTGATPSSGDFVYLQSDPGDYIGRGATNLYQTGIVGSLSGTRAMISAGGYSAVFQGMNSISELKVGYYGGLMRYPLHNPALGGIDVSGEGRGCNRETGWFAIDRVAYANGLVTGIELRFEQRCENADASLHGAVRWGQF